MRMVVSTIAAVLLMCAPAAAQKGTGEPTGVARQAIKPTVTEYSGVVTDVKIGPCEFTTGRSLVGAHLVVRTGTEGAVNLHLGPRDAVQPVIDAAPAGTPIMFEAFRTDAMPADAYVAKSITVDGETMALRDDTLRPTWAMGPGGGGMGPGQGQGTMGQGQGMGSRRGQGAGMGPGSAAPGGGRNPCWWALPSTGEQ